MISHPDMGERPAVGSPPACAKMLLPPGENLGPTYRVGDIAPLFSADLTPRCGLGERSSAGGGCEKTTPESLAAVP